MSNTSFTPTFFGVNFFREGDPGLCEPEVIGVAVWRELDRESSRLGVGGVNSVEGGCTRRDEMNDIEGKDVEEDKGCTKREWEGLNYRQKQQKLANEGGNKEIGGFLLVKCNGFSAEW